MLYMRPACPKIQPPPPSTYTPSPPSVPIGLPVYLYGFLPGNVKVRQISNSDGVLSGNSTTLRLAKLTNARVQAWHLIPQGNGIVIYNPGTNQWITNPSQDLLTLTPIAGQATVFSLMGPQRDGRVYRLRRNDGSSYLAPYTDGNVNLVTVQGAPPTNTEWIVSITGS